MTTNRHTNGCQPLGLGGSYAIDLSAQVPLLALCGPGMTKKPTTGLRAKSGFEGSWAYGGVQSRGPSL